MLVVKGWEYSLDEFLFGQGEIKNNTSFYTNKSFELDEKGRKLNYMIIYLAPGDYHRYHAATSFLINFRRHIVGYLEPVKPSYLEGHPNVFKSNERVSVFGDWA